MHRIESASTTTSYSQLWAVLSLLLILIAVLGAGLSLILSAGLSLMAAAAGWVAGRQAQTGTGRLLACALLGISSFTLLALLVLHFFFVSHPDQDGVGSESAGMAQPDTP